MRRLIIRPGAIGDFILSLPALEFLKSAYTEVWCAGQNLPLVQFADRSISISASGLDRVGIVPASEVVEYLAGFDEIHSWYGSGRLDFRESVRHLPFTFYAALPPAQGRHATDFYCAQVGAAASEPQLHFDSEGSRDFAILHPFASNPAKRWPLTGFQEIAAMLENVRWCAGPEEECEAATRIADLGKLGAWLRNARVYIGNDSGITHLAAAAGVPVVALFGPTDPSIWAPRGERVRVISRVPIASISSAEVMKAVRSLI